MEECKISREQLLTYTGTYRSTSGKGTYIISVLGDNLTFMAANGSYQLVSDTNPNQFYVKRNPDEVIEFTMNFLGTESVGAYIRMTNKFSTRPPLLSSNFEELRKNQRGLYLKRIKKRESRTKDQKSIFEKLFICCDEE